MCSLFSLICTALIPQIISVTVNSLVGATGTGLSQRIAELFGTDRILDHPVSGLLAVSGSILVIALLGGIMTYGQKNMLAKGSEAFVKRIRDNLFAHIQRLPFAWHSANQTGDIIQRCTSDVEVIRNFVCTQLTEVIRTVILVAVDLSIMFSMNLRLSILSCIFLPLIMVASVVFFGQIASRFERADIAEGELTSVVQENLTGVRVVRAFGREQFEIERFDEKNRLFSGLWIHLGKTMSAFWAMGDFLTSLQLMAVVVAGTWETVNGTLTLGEFLAFISYSASLAWPVRGLGRVLSEMSKAGVSIERVGYILNSPAETDAEDTVDAPITGDIVFHNVSFDYDGAQVLRNVSFTIPKGKTFAILGPTGSGKSTLVHLLDRLYDLKSGQGSITIGGVNINDFDRRRLRRQIGIVLQEPFLFSRTILENITVTRPSAQQEEVRRAAEIACVDEAISELNHGYDTVVGERGVTLSGGQKQRVAIARMLLQKTPIMIFDDSLSAVDTETDANIRAALKREIQDATVILISHRITTLMQADCILVLEHGKLSDMGTHKELLSRPGLYKDIFEIQMSSDDRTLLKGGVTDGSL
ncbi:MAG: transporter ATP-binding protein [Oscillospiraceae bacterium]|nr:transporter ATP-binding protein [Oscillospiraceae bacterium]